jgi:hypothetical protein
MWLGQEVGGHWGAEGDPQSSWGLCLSPVLDPLQTPAHRPEVPEALGADQGNRPGPQPHQLQRSSQWHRPLLAHPGSGIWVWQWSGVVVACWHPLQRLHNHLCLSYNQEIE